MRIVFMGSPEFAVPSLERLNETSHEIVAVVSGTDKRRGRRGKPVPTPVKKKAQELNLPTISSETLKSDKIRDELEALNPDLIVVVAFKILPPALLKIPRLGSVNIHASLLPKYRGAAPIHWAVVNGEKETGITIFRLDKGIDTGEILRQEKISIGPNDTTGDVYEQLMKLGADTLPEVVDEIAAGETEPMGQNDEQATKAPKVFNETAHIHFQQSAEKIHNFVRGMNPFPSAWTKLDGRKFTIHETRRDHEKSAPILKPGEISLEDETAWVGTGSDPLILHTVQIQGKQQTDGASFLRGWRGSLKFEDSH